MKKFSVPIAHDPDQLVQEVKRTAQENGVLLTGDHQAGHFKGMGIEGHYAIGDGVVSIVVSKKPIFLTWSLIESKLAAFFSRNFDA